MTQHPRKPSARKIEVSEGWVASPHRKQSVEVVGVVDPPHDQAGGDLLGVPREGGMADLGDLGIRNQAPVSGSRTAPG